MIHPIGDCELNLLNSANDLFRNREGRPTGQLFLPQCCVSAGGGSADSGAVHSHRMICRRHKARLGCRRFQSAIQAQVYFSRYTPSCSLQEGCSPGGLVTSSVELETSPCVGVWLPLTVQSVCEANWEASCPYWCLCTETVVCLSSWPSVKLTTCPECHPAVALWQLGKAAADLCDLECRRHYDTDGRR